MMATIGTPTVIETPDAVDGGARQPAIDAPAAVIVPAGDRDALRDSQAPAAAVPEVPNPAAPQTTGHRIDWQPAVDAFGVLLENVAAKLETRWGSVIVAAYLIVPLTMSPTLVRWVEAIGVDGVLRFAAALAGAVVTTAATATGGN